MWLLSSLEHYFLNPYFIYFIYKWSPSAFLWLKVDYKAQKQFRRQSPVNNGVRQLWDPAVPFNSYLSRAILSTGLLRSIQWCLFPGKCILGWVWSCSCCRTGTEHGTRLPRALPRAFRILCCSGFHVSTFGSCFHSITCISRGTAEVTSGCQLFSNLKW